MFGALVGWWGYLLHSYSKTSGIKKSELHYYKKLSRQISNIKSLQACLQKHESSTVFGKFPIRSMIQLPLVQVSLKNAHIVELCPEEKFSININQSSWYVILNNKNWGNQLQKFLCLNLLLHIPPRKNSSICLEKLNRIKLLTQSNSDRPLSGSTHSLKSTKSIPLVH